MSKIGGCAFEHCSSLTSIVIPDSVSEIGSGAFKNCSSLTSVILPSSLSSIADDAFENCSSLTKQTRLMILALERKSKLKIPRILN